MKRQIGFAEAEIAGKKHLTRHQRFLAEMEKIVPWQRLLSAIEPHYPKGTRSRPPIGLERMLRIHFLQQWYGLSDEGLDDALYDGIALRAFAGTDSLRTELGKDLAELDEENHVLTCASGMLRSLQLPGANHRHACLNRSRLQ